MPSPALTQAGGTVHMQKRYENIYAQKTHTYALRMTQRQTKLAEKRREREDCIFRQCCGVGRGMQCFSVVGGVSDRAMMWGSCVGHTPH